MLGNIGSKQSPWLVFAGSLAVLMSLWTVVRLTRQDMFAAWPVHALLVFLAPVAACCVLAWVRPVRLARVLLLGGLLLTACWVTGLAGVAALGLLLLAAFSIGGLLAHAGAIKLDGLLPAALALALGLAALTLLLTVSAHFPMDGPVIYALTLAGLTAIGWRGLRDQARLLWGWLGDAEPLGMKTWVGCGFFAGAVLLNICYSGLFGFTPDTLAMHLYIPSYMATYGQWSYDFHTYLWALEPIGSDLLFGVVYRLGGDIGAQALNASCFVLIAALIYGICRKRADCFDALLPATAWLCLGYVLYLSGSLHAEGFLTLFLFAGFIYLNDLEATAPPWQSGFVAGLLLAAALAVKVLALVMAPVFMTFLLAVPARARGVPWLLKFLAATALMVAVAGGFQYAYAYATTGNPVFFYYNGVFNSPFFRPVNFVDSHWTGHYGWNLPFDLSFNTQHFAETGPGTVGLQWFMLLPSALLCLLSKEAGRTRWFALAGLWFAALMLASEQYFRYILPALPFLTVLIAEIGAQSGRVLRIIYRTCMLAAIGLDLVALQGALPDQSDLPLDRLLHQDPSERGAQAPVIAANRMIDVLEVAPVNVLYVSRSWGAELRGTAYYQSWYNPELNAAFNHVRTAADVGPILAASKIRYVVVDPSFKRVIKAEEVTAYCRRHGELVATFGPVSLYRVGSTSP